MRKKYNELAANGNGNIRYALQCFAAAILGVGAGYALLLVF